MLMGMAKVAAQRSTCSRAQVGAVIAVDGRVLSTGYNGAPAGMPHCNHECNCGYPGKGGAYFEGKHLSNCSSLAACSISVHAEANAIAYAARHGVRVDRAELFCTHLPCGTCAKLIINSGIARVVFETDYRLKDGSDLLRSAGILTEKLSEDMMGA